MGVIFGTVDFSEKSFPTARSLLIKEKAGILKPDTLNILLEKNVLFGHTQFFSSPESHFEKMPLYDRENGIVMVAVARLYNRDSLLDAFQIPPCERSVTSDGRLAFLAYTDGVKRP